MSGRGTFTPEIAAKMKAFLGRPSSQNELRLLPYIQNVLMNDGYIDQRRINNKERDMLALLVEEGHIESWIPVLVVTKTFWTFMSEILWISYVNRGLT